MLYARNTYKLPFHIIQFNRAVCNATLRSEAVYTKEVRPNERLCQNCKALAIGAQRHQKVEPKQEKDYATRQKFHQEWKDAQAAEARGDYDDLIHVEEICAWTGKGWPIKDLCALHNQRKQVQRLLQEDEEDAISEECRLDAEFRERCENG